MFRAASFSRRCLSLALAIVVIAKMQHCMWEEGREMRQQFEVAACRDAGRPAPVEPKRHDCDNESGCMCRGATLVQSLDVSFLKGQETARLPIDFALTPLGWAADLAADAAAGLPPDEPAIGVRISGRQLRALFASLTI